MEAFTNFLRALSGGEEETPVSSRTSSISNDSGFGYSPSHNSYSESGRSSFGSPFSSRSLSFDESERNNSLLDESPADSPEKRPLRDEQEFSGAEVAAGVAGIAVVALGAYGLGKWLFGSSESHQHPGKRSVLDDDEEEVGRRRPSLKNYFNQSRIERISKEITKDAEEYPVVGFDCQWTQVFDGSRRLPVALLQVSSHKGKVALVRLSRHQKLPNALRLLLNNPHIIKSGIETLKDAQYLKNDYNIDVKGTYDLRYLAEATGLTPDSLEGLSKKVLGRDLNKDFELIESNWDTHMLAKKQIDYAEKAAQASVDIFKELIKKVVPKATKTNIYSYCENNLDRRYVYYSQNW